MPPVPEQYYTPPHDSSDISRRTLLAGVTGAALAAHFGIKVATADRYLPELRYRRRTATAETATSNPYGHNQYAFMFPGMSQDATRALQVGLELGNGPYKEQGMQYLAPADNGLDFDQLVRAYDSYQASTERIHLTTVSLGFLTLARTLARREEMAAEQTQAMQLASTPRKPRPIDSLAVLCGPTSWKDVFYGELLKDIFDGYNPAGRMSEVWAIKTLDRLGKHGESWSLALKNGYNDLKRPEARASGLYRDELKMLVEAKTSDYKDVLARYIGPSTKVVYIKPRDPLADTTVKVLAANQKMAELFRSLGARYDTIEIPGGHADVHNLAKSPRFAAWLKNVEKTVPGT